MTHLLLSAIPWATRSLAEQMSLAVHISAGALSMPRSMHGLVVEVSGLDARAAVRA